MAGQGSRKFGGTLRNIAASTLVMAGLFGISSGAHAAPTYQYGFDNINGGDSWGDSFAQYLSFTVGEYNTSDGSVCDAGCALFKFSLDANSPDAFIGSVYFENPVPDALDFSKVVFFNNSDVKFKEGNQPNLPQGNLVSFVVDYTGTSTNGSWAGVDPGETLGIAVVLSSTFQYLIDALNYPGTDDATADSTKDFRVGIHLQGFAGDCGSSDCSDSYLNNPDGRVSAPPEVPLPAASILLGSAIGLLMFARRRKAA